MAIMEKEFHCKRDELTIRGMQYFPCPFEEKEKYPVAILCHGFTGNYRSMENYGRKFAELGYIAVGFDFCGGGALVQEDPVRSDGETTDMRISTEVEDLSAVIDQVKGFPYTDLQRILLAGVSQGGFVAGLAAARRREEISGLIMVYPALCIPDHARRGCLGGACYDPKEVPDRIDCGRSVLGKGFHDEVAGMDPFLELSAYGGRVLLIQGLEDGIVDYSYAVKARASYEKGQCRLQLVRNMGHSPDEGQFESIFASIRQFLAGREEILSIRIIITHSEKLCDNGAEQCKLYFTGYCESPYFQGTVLPGGCDVRREDPGKGKAVRAEYTLEGLDCEGQRCRLHIVNQWGQEDWEPVIRTDSRALAWLNEADLTAVLENGAGGPTVRIFAGRAGE